MDRIGTRDRTNVVRGRGVVSIERKKRERELRALAEKRSSEVSNISLWPDSMLKVAVRTIASQNEKRGCTKG